MTKVVLISFLILVCFSCKSSFEVTERPTDYSTVIKNKHFEGVIFSENADCFLCLLDKKRFSPTLQDISKAEEILKQKLKAENTPLINQGGRCPFIHKNLKNYRRQYFGYFNEEGDKVIYTTLNWDKYTLWDWIRGYSRDNSEDWKKQKEMILDGCSHHWEININLSDEELFGLNINGGA